MYYLLVISTHIFSSIIMIIFLLDILVKTKHWNLFAMDIPGPASILMYNNFASSVLLVCNISYNVISLMDFSNNSLYPNNHRIPFIWTLYVTSNRGLEFVLNFFYSLNTALDMWLYFTSSYHTEDNRQTKYMN